MDNARPITGPLDGPPPDPAPGGPDAPAGGLRGRILLTGATGFLGQALLERLLADHPQTSLDLLIRATGSTTAHERLDAVVHGAALRGWRRRVGESAADRAVTERLTVLPGGLADARRLVAGRPAYDLVIHAAGEVSFRPGIGAAFATNVAGPQELYEAVTAAAARAGRPAPHVIHVSTSYVWTDRVAIGTERRVEHDVDWRAELEHARRLQAAVDQVDDARRLVDRLVGTAAGGGAAGDARAAERRLLADAGYERARELGWTDVYTFSKAMGERVAEDVCAAGPVTVLRPTIIESALERPYPGWLDGFKVADPLIAAYGRGRLPVFPGYPAAVLDVIPVDVVVNAALAAARRPPAPGRPRYLQVGTSVSNPLRLDDLRRHVQDHFRRQPYVTSHGRIVHPRPLRFVGSEAMRRRLRRASTWTLRVLTLAGALPAPAAAPATARLGRTAQRLAATHEFVQLYQPYSCSTTRYDDAALRALDRDRPAAERDREPLDVTRWRWSDYLDRVHLPAVSRLLREHALGARAAGRPPVADLPGAAGPGAGRRAAEGREADGRTNADRRTGALPTEGRTTESRTTGGRTTGARHSPALDAPPGPSGVSAGRPDTPARATP